MIWLMILLRLIILILLWRGTAMGNPLPVTAEAALEVHLTPALNQALLPALLNLSVRPLPYLTWPIRCRNGTGLHDRIFPDCLPPFCPVRTRAQIIDPSRMHRKRASGSDPRSWTWPESYSELRIDSRKNCCFKHGFDMSAYSAGHKNAVTYFWRAPCIRNEL